MIVPKFNINQEVYVVESIYNTRHEHVKCDLCNSTGVINVKDKEGEYVCPKCRGHIETINEGFKYIISNHGKIGKIITEEYSPKYGKSEIKYMIDSTGVGSGTLWYESRIFPCKEEAKEFCDTYIPTDWYDSGKEKLLKDK